MEDAKLYGFPDRTKEAVPFRTLNQTRLDPEQKPM